MKKRIQELRRLMEQATRDGELVPEAACELAPIIKALKRLGSRLIDEQLARSEDDTREIDHPEPPETGAKRDRRTAETWEELTALKFVLRRLIVEERAAKPF